MKYTKKKPQLPVKKRDGFPIGRFLSLFIFGLICSFTFTFKTNYDRRVALLQSVLHNSNEVLGMSTDPINISVDFSQQIAIGSPLVFGGASSPSVQDQAAWDLLASVGITSVRRDFWMETELPTKISLADYKNNKNNVQDPKNWNWTTGWTNITTTNQTFQNAKKRGMKTIAILTYAPAWLTYSGTEHGVPKDWDVYRDIVKKLYRIHRPNIDMMEVWNEPTYTNFLVLTNSPYRNRADAYRDIYINAVRAIHEVDSEINDGRIMPIISVVGHTPMDTSVLEGLLSTEESKSLMTAVSYHNYHIDEPSNTYYKETLKKYGKSNLPLFVTEWNYSPEETKTNPYHTTDLAIAYTGKKLIGFLNQGIAGANYFALNLNDPTKVKNFQSAFGFYRVDSTKKPYLLPQGKTWQLLSKSLGLGLGTSRIYKTEPPTSLEMTAFINSSNQKGLAFVNDTYLESEVSISLSTLGVTNYDTIQVYGASKTQDGKTPCTLDLINSTPNQQLWLIIPAQSVVGLTVTTQQPGAATVLKKVLGPSTTTTCALLK